MDSKHDPNEAQSAAVGTVDAPSAPSADPSSDGLVAIDGALALQVDLMHGGQSLLERA